VVAPGIAEALLATALVWSRRSRPSSSTIISRACEGYLELVGRASGPPATLSRDLDRTMCDAFARGE